jgi:hypothetical protein
LAAARDMLAPTDYEITEAEDGEQRKSRINSPPDRPVITKPGSSLSFEQSLDLHPLPGAVADIDGLHGLQYA